MKGMNSRAHRTRSRVRRDDVRTALFASLMGITFAETSPSAQCTFLEGLISQELGLLQS